MTQLEWQQLEQTVQNLSAAEKDRLRLLLNRSLAGESSVADPLLGLMADEPDLVDRVLEAALMARERDPLRAAANAEDAA
jgi:hypothetical protein